ncbi:hypothetical protein, partial [Mycobacterium sp.]|uniref:hypothetical protein n=1 Tax=Mycobacterium sp. TaxID=1785 RepID=UPI0025EDAC85
MAAAVAHTPCPRQASTECAETNVRAHPGQRYGAPVDPPVCEGPHVGPTPQGPPGEPVGDLLTFPWVGFMLPSLVVG